MGKQEAQGRAAAEPTNQVHEFAMDELFFSATDSKGKIELANSTFVRLSGRTLDELTGAPHNIIRHPAMPGAAFKMVWNQLGEGRGACAYIRNLAADGGYYDVFATIQLVGDKLLSVRMRPLVDDLYNASAKLYTKVREHENKLREEGASRDEAASQGLTMLLDGLGELGITSAVDLALTALPAEIAKFERRFQGLPRRPEETGPLADLLTCTHDLSHRTAALIAELEDYEELVGVLKASYADAAPTADRLTTLSTAISGAAELPAVVKAAADIQAEEMSRAKAAGLSVEPGETAIESIVQRATSHTSSATERLKELGEELSTAAELVRWLRMRIALFRLHNTMVATFTAELIDGKGVGDEAASLELLARALREGAEELASAEERVNVAAQRIPALVQDAVRDADRVLRSTTKWRSELDSLGCATEAAEQMATVSETQKAGFDELRRFHEVAARCATMARPYDRGSIDDAVGRLGAALEAYRTQAGASKES